ncbi:MAG: BMP family ABC transporter substrate-binding protein [Lachnospiraceae bacterium]
MALYDYMNARRQARRQYQLAVAKGEYPYLPVLDEILKNADIVSEVNLGLMDVPLEKIVGTKTSGRTQSFANNFMPLLAEKTEFGAKWAYLYDHQISEGIHDPIMVYEFMNRYYVQEGNKRVSVLKYLRAYSITASVIRLIPRRTDELNNKLYYEFLDFYQVSFNCDVWFSKEGSYYKLLKAMGKKDDEIWDDTERQYFKAVYDLFVRVFHDIHTDEMGLTASDAFLIYVEIFGYDLVKERTESQIKKDMVKLKDELLLTSRGNEIELVEQPEEMETSQSGSARLINWLIPSANIEPEMLKIAFIHSKSKDTSSWVYSHELGRLYLENCFDGKLKTVAYENAGTDEEIEQAIEQAIAEKCNMIFTTASQMISQSVKAALQYPQVKIFNCSVNMSYTSICTYYTRLYEAKFLMGALAAAMNGTDKIGYISDYPIYGSVSNINAFALGAQMINPNTKIYLKWSRLKDQNYREVLQDEGISFISDSDLITPKDASREYGLYHRMSGGPVDNLATAFCHWGKFYERIVRLICNGDGSLREWKGKKAVNYWWGMSADVIDVICSRDLPNGTRNLINHLSKAIKSGVIHPFDGLIYAQDGDVKCQEGKTLSPEEIIKMNWLAGNVIGGLPKLEDFTQEAQALIGLQGVRPYRH